MRISSIVYDHGCYYFGHNCPALVAMSNFLSRGQYVAPDSFRGLWKCYQHQPQKGLITVLGCEPPLALSKNTPIDLMRRVLSAVPSKHVCPGKGCELRDTFGRRDSDFLSTRKSPRLKDQSEKPHRGRRLIEQEKHRRGEKCSK